MFIAVGTIVENTNDDLPDIAIDACRNLTYDERCAYAEIVSKMLNNSRNQSTEFQAYCMLVTKRSKNYGHS